MNYKSLYSDDQLLRKLAVITISFDRAQALNAIGLEQKSIFYYDVWFGTDNIRYYNLNFGSITYESYSAYTVGELIKIARNMQIIPVEYAKFDNPNYWADLILDKLKKNKEV